MLSFPWSRQGARNIAGVTYQVAVSAHLLVLGRAGKLPIVAVTPEGMEDVDCTNADGSVLIVQAKERGGGTGTLACAQVADILDHARPALRARPGSRFALVTNAQLGTGLVFTGWNGSLSQALFPERLEELMSALDQSDGADALDLAGRVALVALEREIGVQTTRDISVVYNVAPAVAALVYSRLVEDLGEVAARQRHAQPATATSRQLTDLDALVQRVLETVDADQLDAAVRAGIVEVLDFTAASTLPRERFLLGIDVAPAHVAANLDLPRESALVEILESIREGGYTAIVGPSGSGKSSLLWRSARICEWAAYKARVLHLSEDEVPELMRWVRSRAPSPHAPLLLCADNLGRPSMAGWATAAARLREVPGVLLLGAVRREDFNASLIASGPTVFEPQLERDLASSIAASLSGRGIQPRLDSDEAFARAEGLLMEFLSLLLAGHRIRDVVAAQVAERLGPDRKTERQALRFVCAAHRLGLTLPAEILGRLLGQPDDLAFALSRLHDEHLITENERTEWGGLHELRSDIINREIHALPPPSEADTYAKLLQHLPSATRPLLLRRYGRHSHAPVLPLTAVVVHCLTAEETSCEEAASLLDSVRECEAARYARECLRVALTTEDRRLPSPSRRLMFAILMRETGFALPFPVPGVEVLAAALPARPESFLTSILAEIGEVRISALATGGTPEAVAHFLESLEGYFNLTKTSAAEIWARHSAAPFYLRIRLLVSLARLAMLSSAELFSIAGPVEDRAAELARYHPCGLDARVHLHANEGLVVTIEVMVPTSTDDAHQQAVTLAEQIFAQCPEAAVAEIITREPGGRQLTAGGYNSAYKRIPRGNLPRFAENRLQREFLDSVERLLAARFWTERLRAEAEISGELLFLLDQLPARILNRHDNQRRREEWKARAKAVNGKILPPPPQPETNLGKSSSPASETEARRAPIDLAAQALDAVSLALRQLASGLDEPPERMALHIASQLRQALLKLSKAMEEPRPKLSSIGDPLPSTLKTAVQNAADLLFALAACPDRPLYRERGNAPSWNVRAEQVVAEVRGQQVEEERLAIQTVCERAGIAAEIQLLPHYNPNSLYLSADRWAIRIRRQDWGAVSRFLEQSDELRRRMSFRTFIIASESQFVLPFLAMMVGSQSLFPADHAIVEELCRQAGWSVAISPHLPAFNAFIGKMLEASRLAALHWQRRAEWMRDSELVSASDLIESAQTDLSAISNQGIQLAGEQLMCNVRRELSQPSRPFAAAFYNYPPEPEDAAMFAEISKLSLAVAECDLRVPSEDS